MFSVLSQPKEVFLTSLEEKQLTLLEMYDAYL